MSAISTFKTVLIFGGTSGIGESFARRFHAMGKKVIVTGRREARLAALAKELPGVETYVLDNADISKLPTHAEALIKKFPDIDTVWVNSGLAYVGHFRSLDGHSDEKVVTELNTNLVAPIILSRYFVPHLLSLDRPGSFLVTGSGLGFVPMGLLSVYCASKAAVHSFLVGLRESLKDTNVNVIEVVAPYVKTDFDKDYPMEHLATPMELGDYTDQTLAIFESTPAADLKEAGVGFGAMGASAWREAFGRFLTGRGSTG
ncbi:hypothetical protein LTR84_011729 [Exophiala bonariae]|uniref:Short-chain dehydrogenase n=1 Tax=Exophiala bonariae TaxID=1690606 RepID=A0AAV9NKG3_9EURO|nr:hypothetical protein LTR84_011729 [Exophiala bonariae]